MMDFEQYLQDKHTKDYRGCDDDMPDDFNNWMQDLDVEQWLVFGDGFAAMKSLATLDNVGKGIKEIFRKESE